MRLIVLLTFATFALASCGRPIVVDPPAALDEAAPRKVDTRTGLVVEDVCQEKDPDTRLCK